jgi:hypothetical protein
MEPLVQLELSESLVQRALLELAPLAHRALPVLAQRARLVQPGSTGQQVLLELLVSQERQALPELRAVMVLQARQVSSV